MSDHKTDPADRIFEDDDLIEEIGRKRNRIAAAIADMAGVEPRRILVLGEIPAGLPPEGRELVKELDRLSAEFARRNGRRTSQRLTRFMAALNGEAEMTPAMRRWWMNRY